MRVFVFYLIYLTFVFYPFSSSTYIDEDEEKKALKANPIVVAKLLEKLQKYQNEITIAKDSIIKNDDFYENGVKVTIFLNFFIYNESFYVCYCSLKKQIITFSQNHQKILNIIFFQHQNRRE